MLHRTQDIDLGLHDMHHVFQLADQLGRGVHFSRGEHWEQFARRDNHQPASAIEQVENKGSLRHISPAQQEHTACLLPTSIEFDAAAIAQFEVIAALVRC